MVASGACLEDALESIEEIAFSKWCRLLFVRNALAWVGRQYVRS